MKQEVFPLAGETCWSGTLSCGLPVFVYPKPEFQRYFAFFATNYGGMDVAVNGQEDPAGVAHFLEHKMFDMPNGNALQELTRQGASPNAFTSAAITGYHFSCTEGFEDKLRTLLTFVTTPYFTAESVEKEQGIIGQEIAMVEDDPGWVAYHSLLEGLYESHPVRLSVAGSKESIRNITHETLHQCYDRAYHPGNIALCVAGPVNPEEVLALADTVITQEADAPLSRQLPQEGENAFRAETVRRMEVAMPLFFLGFKGPAVAEGPERLRMQLIGDLAGELLCGDSSPLYHRLYREGLINRSFGVSFSLFPGASFLAAGGESRSPRETAEAILEESARLGRDGVDEELFRRVKKALYGARVRSLGFEQLCIQTVQGYFDGCAFLTFPEVLESLRPEDISDFLRRFAVPERKSLALVEPLET